MEERGPVPDEQPNTLSSDARELLESSAYFYTQIHPCKGDFRNRTIDTRTKGKPTSGDLEDISKVIMELMKQCKVSPMDNPFSTRGGKNKGQTDRQTTRVKDQSGK